MSSSFAHLARGAGKVAGLKAAGPVALVDPLNLPESKRSVSSVPDGSL